MLKPITRRTLLRAAAVIAVPAAIVTAAVAQQTAVVPDEPLIAGFKATYPASVSDAVELVTGKSGTMRHDMKLVTGKALVGRAVDVAREARPARGGDARSRDEALGRDDRRGQAG